MFSWISGNIWKSCPERRFYCSMIFRRVGNGGVVTSFLDELFFPSSTSPTSLEIMVQLPFSLHAIIVAPFVKQSFSRQFTARIHCNDSQAKTTNCSWLQKKRKEGSASPSPTFTSLLRVERLNVFKKKCFNYKQKILKSVRSKIIIIFLNRSD